jgi:hypothetical protein
MTKGKDILVEKKIPTAPAIKEITAQDFAMEYEALCARMGWQIIGYPKLKPMNDLGGCLIAVQLQIAPFKPITSGDGDAVKG